MSATASPRANRPAIPEHDSPAGDFKLSQRVREIAGDEPDPHKVAELVIKSLTGDELVAALSTCLPGYVRGVITPGKKHNMALTTRSRRWKNAAEIRGEIALLRASVFARGTWKFLGDCEQADVMDLAERRDQDAIENRAAADRFRATAAALKKHKAKTVRDLPAEVLEEIFHA